MKTLFLSLLFLLYVLAAVFVLTVTLNCIEPDERIAGCLAILALLLASADVSLHFREECS